MLEAFLILGERINRNNHPDVRTRVY